MDLFSAIELTATVSGVAYVILEIFQKKAMWVVGIITGAACAWAFGKQHLWASMALNLYYMAVSLWGLREWSRDEVSAGDSAIHLRPPGRGVVLVSLACTLAGTAALYFMLRWLGDSQSLADAFVTVLSAVATLWLAKSYPQQWLLWIVADLCSTMLCLTAGLNWMAALYLIYCLSAVYGWFHWRSHGRYIP